MKIKNLSIVGGVIAAGIAVAIVNKATQMYFPHPRFVSIGKKILFVLYLTNVPNGA